MKTDLGVESEANQFAMELLMPEHLVVAYLKSHGGIDLSGDGTDVKNMAKAFSVGPITMGIRIGKLL